MSLETNELYAFGDFRFDPATRVLWRDGEIVPLAPKASEVLFLLLSEQGDLVPRQQIFETVWSDAFVEEGNLNQAISALRKVLGSGYIHTIPRRGYRFNRPVSVIPAENERVDLVLERRLVSETIIEETVESVPTRVSTKPALLIAAACGILILSLMAGYRYFNNEDPSLPLTGTRTIQSLAIIPFRPINKVEEDKGLADGITETLAQRLGSATELVVRPNASVESFAKVEGDPLAVGRKLGVDAVMTGIFQRADGRVRLNIRLLRTTDGKQIWAGSFDEDEQDIFRLQDSLASQAAIYLLDQLTARQQQLLAKRPTEDVEAYKLYIRGRYEWSKRTAEGFEHSIADFRAAIDRDPNFALAYAGLADSYVLLADYNLQAPSEAFPKAKAAALKALESDSSTAARAHATLAYILATYDWDYSEAEREYRLAIQSEPNYATAHQWYGELLGALHRFEEAESELARAAELDPLVPITLSERAVLMYYSGRLDDALAQFTVLKKEHPSFSTSYIFTAWINDLEGHEKESLEDEIAYLRLRGIDEKSLDGLREAFAQGGREEFLRQVVKRFEKDVERGAFPSYNIPHTYARLRDREMTLRWIEKCIEAHSPSIIKIYSDPNFYFLRDDPRFNEALKNLHLPA